MNGNDIVDLKVANFPDGSRKTRFFDKIFSPREKEIINNGRSGIWELWAMKEAVYKAHQRRFNLARSFDPKSIKVFIHEASDSLIVAHAEYKGCLYTGKGITTSDYTHFSVTGFPQAKLYSEIHNTAFINIKTQLIQVISGKLGLEPGELNIIKDQNSIPQLEHKHSGYSIPFSFSHHGNYSAFSFQLINY